jgi:ArsR family transcriptional regulator
MQEQLVMEIELLHQKVCSAVGDPKRVMILYALAERPKYVSELADELGLPQPTVSRHLKILSDRGMVTAAREGTTVFYTLGDERIIQALDLMRGILRDLILRDARVMESSTAGT